MINGTQANPSTARVYRGCHSNPPTLEPEEAVGSARQVANQLGCAPASISRYLAGRRIRSDVAERLAKIQAELGGAEVRSDG